MTEHRQPYDRDNLLRLIEAAKARKMTPEERDAQCRSFVRGQLGFGSDADEAAYRDALAKGDTPALARLEAEAQARMSAADALTAAGPWPLADEDQRAAEEDAGGFAYTPRMPWQTTAAIVAALAAFCAVIVMLAWA